MHMRMHMHVHMRQGGPRAAGLRSKLSAVLGPWRAHLRGDSRSRPSPPLPPLPLLSTGDRRLPCLLSHFSPTSLPQVHLAADARRLPLLRRLLRLAPSRHALVRGNLRCRERRPDRVCARSHRLRLRVCGSCAFPQAALHSQVPLAFTDELPRPRPRAEPRLVLSQVHLHRRRAAPAEANGRPGRRDGRDGRPRAPLCRRRPPRCHRGPRVRRLARDRHPRLCMRRQPLCAWPSAQPVVLTPRLPCSHPHKADR